MSFILFHGARRPSIACTGSHFAYRHPSRIRISSLCFREILLASQSAKGVCIACGVHRRFGIFHAMLDDTFACSKVCRSEATQQLYGTMLGKIWSVQVVRVPSCSHSRIVPFDFSLECKVVFSIMQRPADLTSSVSRAACQPAQVIRASVAITHKPISGRT